MLKELLKRTAQELDLGEVDLSFVFDENGIARMILPHSERAINLFYRWGMESTSVGITPPDNPADLIESVPQNWLSVTLTVQQVAEAMTEAADIEPDKEGYSTMELRIQQVPLPQPLMVVH